MTIKSTLALLLIVSLLIITQAGALAAEQKPIELPKPEKTGGKPLMQALNDRHTSREFSSKELPPQVLSDLLWAAFGVNRPESGKRTAPSALNWQEIDIYVARSDGLYRFNAKEHTLGPIIAEDIRALTGRQEFVKDAPINLIYVADYTKMTMGSDEDKATYSAADTGFISQNVYLFCASEGLSTVVRGLIDKPALAKAMKLGDSQKIVLTQTVGYPKE